MQHKAAIYHFTNGSSQRPKVYLDQLLLLRQFAVLNGWSITGEYVDFSLKRCERTEFNHFLSDCSKYDILVVKDFYHISKNTMECIKIIKELGDKGVEVHSIENGSFIYEDVPLGKALRIATYNCRFGPQDESSKKIQIQDDIFKLFTKKKTSWKIIDQYADESKHQNDGEQKNLMKLISNHDKYDLILVSNFNDIHWRTAKFCKLRDKLKLAIYSLQDGLLTYRKDSKCTNKQ